MREKIVDRGEEKVKRGVIAGRTLRMPGLKPSDYFLFKEARATFNFDMRQVFVLGLRLLYRCFFDVKYRSLVYEIAGEIAGENLDLQDTKVVYEEFSRIKAQ